MTTPGRHRQTLADATDAAIARHNARMADPARAAEAHAAGALWAKWRAGEVAVGSTAVVLPIRLAEDVMRVIAGEPTGLPRDTIVAMLAEHIERAASRRA